MSSSRSCGENANLFEIVSFFLLPSVEKMNVCCIASPQLATVNSHGSGGPSPPPPGKNCAWIQIRGEEASVTAITRDGPINAAIKNAALATRTDFII